MELSTAPRGKIITFYSYKGGTGRSMAVANVACLLGRSLAKTSQRVLVMDWDLEAPGLHRFFSARCEIPEYKNQEGVTNYFCALRDLLQNESGLYEALTSSDGGRLLTEKLPLEPYITPDVVPGVDFMRAGQFNEDYARLASSFDWLGFYTKYQGIIRTFREVLADRFAYVLVDSRTGITDVSGICTTLLPEKLVGVFVPNRQNIDGLCSIVRQAITYRSQADDFRPLSVFPLPSRIENAENDQKEFWRTEYESEFETLFKREYQIETCDLSRYLDAVLIPQKPYFAYGEKIAVLEERPDATSLSAAYQRFFDRLFTLDNPWDSADTAQPPVPATLETPVKPETIQYDAYLGFVPDDSRAVAQIESRLAKLNVRCFLASRDLAAGEEFAGGTLKAMNESKVIVVFLGPSGLGPWQDQQALTILERFAREGSKKIVPVLLPLAAAVGFQNVPRFLSSVQWVDMRSQANRLEIENLAWSITGVRPEQRYRFGSPRLIPIVSAVLPLLILLVALAFEWPHWFPKPTPPMAQPQTSPEASKGLTQVQELPSQFPSSKTDSRPLATAAPLVSWTGGSTIDAWCYQELGSIKSEKGWKLLPGKYGAYCHYLKANCEKARTSGTVASPCVYLEGIGLKEWGGIPRRGLYTSWYRLNLTKQLPPPFPQIETQDSPSSGTSGSSR